MTELYEKIAFEQNKALIRAKFGVFTDEKGVKGSW